MKAFRALVRVSMTALLKAIAPGKAGAALSLGLLSGVALLISVLYGGILAVVLAPLGALDLLPSRTGCCLPPGCWLSTWKTCWSLP